MHFARGFFLQFFPIQICCTIGDLDLFIIYLHSPFIQPKSSINHVRLHRSSIGQNFPLNPEKNYWHVDYSGRVNDDRDQRYACNRDHSLAWRRYFFLLILELAQLEWKITMKMCATHSRHTSKQQILVICHNLLWQFNSFNNKLSIIYQLASGYNVSNLNKFYIAYCVDIQIIINTLDGRRLSSVNCKLLICITNNILYHCE